MLAATHQELWCAKVSILPLSILRQGGPLPAFIRVETIPSTESSTGQKKLPEKDRCDLKSSRTLGRTQRDTGGNRWEEISERGQHFTFSSVSVFLRKC